MTAEHDIRLIWAEMRAKCVNNTVANEHLWREWKQVGPPGTADTHCLCGVKILHDYTMINILNGATIWPIGSKCILNAIGQGYKCYECGQRFIDEIKRPAIDRRLAESDWVCSPCRKSLKNKAETWLYDIEDIAHRYPVTWRTESFRAWAIAVKDPQGRLKEYINDTSIRHWELRKATRAIARAKIVVPSDPKIWGHN